jgi:hypothetical protein
LSWGSILSLLIVDADEEKDYYVTFFCGIVTVLLFHQLHYRSQPHNPNHHATRRNKDAGIWWTIVNAIYSASLIAVGVSYKLFMKSFHESERRKLHKQQESFRDLLDADYVSQRPAHLFSASMAIAFCCLDLMSLLHRGLYTSINRCHCKYTKKKNFLGISITIGRICLILFIATLSQYVTSPKILIGVLSQLLIRRLGHVAFLDREERAELIHGKHEMKRNSFLNRGESLSPSSNDEHSAQRCLNKSQQDCQTDVLDPPYPPQHLTPGTFVESEQDLPDKMSQLQAVKISKQDDDRIQLDEISGIPANMLEMPISNTFTEAHSSETDFPSFDPGFVENKNEVIVPVKDLVCLRITASQRNQNAEESALQPFASKHDDEIPD